MVVIDTATNKVVATVKLDFPVTAIAVGADGRVYATGRRPTSSVSGVGVVAVISAAHKLSKTINLGASVAHNTALAVSPDGKSLVVGWGVPTSFGVGYNAAVTTISTASLKVIRTVLFDGSITDLVVTRDSKTAVVTATNRYPAELVKVDLASGVVSQIDVRAVGDTPRSIVLSPGGAFAYVAMTHSPGDVLVVALGSGDVLTTIDADSTHWVRQIELSQDGKHLFTVEDDVVTTVDIASRNVIDVLSVSPRGVRYLEDITVTSTGRVYVSSPVRFDVVVLTMYPVSAPPTLAVTVGDPSDSTGAVKGTINASDLNGNPLIYSATVPQKGKLTLTKAGQFTYTPSPAARHAAASANATAADKSDTFEVTVSNAFGGTASVTVTVAVGSTNRAPKLKATAASPSPSTGVVTGVVKANDKDKDTLVYSVQAVTAKGSVTIDSSGAFTYTPTVAASIAAGAKNAKSAAKNDTFTVTVQDGHGGISSIAVNVKIASVKVASAAGLREVIAARADKSPDYVYIQKVHNSADKQDKLIVYLGGTQPHDLLSIVTNLPAYSGVIKPAQVARIAAAIAASGNPLIPVMLVGFSQGGMDAQNIAASGLLVANIKAVVTFGSPIVQFAPGLMKTYDIVHLEDNGDPIPDLDLLYNAPQRASNELVGNVFKFSSPNNKKKEASDKLWLHGQVSTYVDVAKAFDKKRGFDEAKRAIKKFYGAVVG